MVPIHPHIAGTHRAAIDMAWCGNLAIQKLVYLLENVCGADLQYEYGLHHLGPYCYELANHLSMGEREGLWQCQNSSFAGPSGHVVGKRYHVTPEAVPSADTSIEANRRWLAVKPSLDALMSQINGQNGRTLELIATLHYLRTVQGIAEPDILDVLRLLKPKFSVNETRWGIGNLAEIEQRVGASAVAV